MDDGNDVDKVVDLLMAADKYDVAFLKVRCAKRLGRMLDVGNALQILIAFYQSNVPFFFLSKNAKAVMWYKKEFMEFIINYPNLCFEAIQHMI